MVQKTFEDGAAERRQVMARRLQQLREVLSGNQAAVARLCGVPVGTWNRYEKGVRDIDPHVLAEFCKKYSVSADWVLLGDLYSLPPDVLATLVRAYPDLAPAVPQRYRLRRPNSDQSADS